MSNSPIFSALNYRRLFLSLIAILTLTLTLIFGNIHPLTAQTNQQHNSNINPPTVPVVLASRFQIKPEKRELFLDVATKALKPSRAEPGNISYGFYEDPNVPNSFIYFEEWKSREALAEHLQQPYAKAVVDNFPNLVQGSVDFKIYDIKSLTNSL